MIIVIEEAVLDGQGALRVSGWAAGEAPVDSVEIIAAGMKLGEADYGRARPDVAADHPELVNAAHSGFLFAADLDDHARQAQQAFVVVRALGRPAQAAVRTIAREDAPAADFKPSDMLRFHCDSVTLYDNGVVEILGWAAHLNEVESIEVSLDGAPIGFAIVGGLRLDVGKSHPDIPSAGRGGFSFRATLEAVAAGQHELALAISTRQGDRFVRKLAAATQIARESGRAVEREDIRLFIDSPKIAEGAATDPLRRMLAIDGWAIARNGLAAVELFLDGAPVGVASRGVRRLDIGAAYPDWPDALMSGFAAMLPRKLFSRDKHVLRVSARDKRGQVQETEFQVAVEPADLDDERAQLRAFAPQAEIDLKMRLLAAAPGRVAFTVLILPGEGESALARTLESLAAQAYPHFRVGLLAPGAEAREGVGPRVFEAGDGLNLAAAVEALLEGERGPGFFLCLRAGDRLGVDALLEFALEIVTRPEEDFHYADDRRPDVGQSKTIAFFKPEWSPDLLLSTNYIGRAWCAARELLARVQVSVADVLVAGDYDLALRLTEAAREIGRAPLVLAETAPASDDPAREIAALRAAMARRGIRGGMRATATPGVYRLRRRVETKGLVSIVIPTIASGGLIETCLESLRKRTCYRNFEIVCVDNIKDETSPWKDWLKSHADCVVEYPAPFNWSKLNNLGAEAALGEYLLFLNDDVEAVDPRWLHALMEHAQRPEVGVVGPRLLYPDGRVQHAGMFLMDDNARHAFRFAEADDPGPFGLAAAQRNVASITGACMLMRRAAFKELGGFDEAHGIVNNDLDLCLRTWRAGLRVVYTPHATLIHREMASRGELKDSFDEAGFDKTWRNAFALGDPFFHPRLSRDTGDYAPEPEPARVIVAGRPLLARESVKRILVQKLDHIGDFITGLPAIQRLKLRFPDAEIHLLAPAASAALAALEPAIANVIEFNFFHSVSQLGRREVDEEEWRALEARLKPYRFDIAVDLRKLGETREALKHSGARLTAGFDQRGAFPWLDVALEWEGDLPYLEKRAQVAEDYIMLAEAVSLACEADRSVVANTPAEATLAALRALPALGGLRGGLFERPIVVVQPGSGNVLRQWPAEHFGSLIDLIADAFDVNLALIGGPGEAAVAEAVLQHARATAQVWSLVGLTKIEDTPTLLRAARLFVGNNSGPHHIAAALGVPTVGVHSGVVSAREWGPLGPMAAAVQREMSCGPCYLAKPSQCPRGIACLQGLRPADVFRVCEQMLGAGLRRGA